MRYFYTMKYLFAPIQGHTDSAYRHFHALTYGIDALSYTTPFIRLEKGEIRKKDINDLTSVLNQGMNIIPQIIFKDLEELSSLTKILKDIGFSKIDINAGCPFPLQTARGRGAAVLSNQRSCDAVAKVIEDNQDISFSVKMRIGFDKEEWEYLIKTLNSCKLEYITVHPRKASDQYKGSLSMDVFSEIYEKSENPIVYNGDIKTPADAWQIMNDYPELKGIMIGRGALGRPSIFNEIIIGKEMSSEERILRMKTFHNRLLSHYKSSLIGGDHQILSKIQPFWEYAEEEIGRKAWKSIRKASSMAKYQTGLAFIK